MIIRGARRRRALGAVAALLALAACSSDTDSPVGLEPVGGGPVGGPIGGASAEPTGNPTPSGITRVGPEALGPVAPGERPPQVVAVAFDGAGVAVGGKYPQFQFWRDVSRDANARFTYFLSGPYLLTHDNIDKYTAPQLGTARQSMPFQVSGVLPLPGQTETDAVRYELEQLRDAHAEGSEIGTHWNGHICGDQKGSVARFSAEDWQLELDQFRSMIDNANSNNGIDPPVELGFTGADVVGSRTPCLEGNYKALYPVLEKAGFLYETSPTPDASSPTAWPQRGWPETGPTSMWVFPLPYVPSYGTGRRILAMDYNFCFQHDRCNTKAAYPTSTTDAWGQQALDTYRQYFQRNYTGNRAPVILGNHFAMWHNGAYSNALADFVTETCRKPEVRCVSYRELAEWLNATPEDQLKSWRLGEFDKYVDPNPPAYGQPVPNAPRPQAAEG
ncbi:hypothetical protein GCM10009547_08330 [Sporichthya brevicatena]|uniref:Polysaccharide deacetylase n=1 Tax=Sporichthya brevicatena TaxID=171442 RepID=A0ABN1GCL3_9ACTN